MPLRERLTITTALPSFPCVSSCNGDVQGFAENGVLTVSSYQGVSHRNIESRVCVGDASFRNPVFLQDPATGTAQQVQWEVDVLLKHPTQKLIQRMGTSNSTKACVRAVEEAFRTGAYDGKVYSGMHGDLAATFVAIALHSEAQQLETGVNAACQGALREPFLKVVHFLRSMEHQDGAGHPVFFGELQNVIGQFPYQSPLVCPFFAADFELPMRSTSESEPEPEVEAEAEPETEAGAEAQAEAESETEAETEAEAQAEAEAEEETESEAEGEAEGEMLDSLADAGPVPAPSTFSRLSFLLNMSNVISVETCGNNVVGNEVRYVPENGGLSALCTVGQLRFKERATLNETVSLLDLLMTTHTGGTVVRAYESASEGHRLQAAQEAVVLSAQFNTFGNPLGLDTVRSIPVWEPPKLDLKPYKALVYVHMAEGADTHNLVVLLSRDIYDEYVEARTNLTLTPEEVPPCCRVGTTTKLYHLRNSRIFASVEDDGPAACFVNAGGLMRPLIMGLLKFTEVHGLFSHSAQTTGGQTFKCQESGTGPRGSGGTHRRRARERFGCVSDVHLFGGRHSRLALRLRH